VDKEIRAFESKLAEKKVSLEVTEGCRLHLARQGYSPEFGARNVARLVQEKIKNLFVDAVLFGELAGGGTAVVDYDEARGEVVVQRKNPAKKKSSRKPRKAAQPKGTGQTGAKDEAAAEPTGEPTAEPTD
jgi:ATP-dependent Clp protease ATP-binding subunit ClpA